MNNLDQAVKIIKDGGIVIFPTDTAFAIGCRMDNKDSVEKLFKIRHRPITQATPVLVSSINMAEDYWQSPTPNNVRQLLNENWPGALTIVYPCKNEKVLSLVCGSGSNLGVRMPNHQILLKIINQVGVPILGPSANFHKDMTPFKFEDLNPALLKSVDFVLKGSCQLCSVSTVIDCSVNPWRILRQGAVQVEYAE